MKRPYAYLVRQSGLREYDEIVPTKRAAAQAARELLWLNGEITVVPLYAGQPVTWISKRRAAKLARALGAGQYD